MEKINRFVSNLKKVKNILICPLDWGLGHATRIVPLVDLLLKENCKVIIGADNGPLKFLSERFPNCKIIKFPGFTPSYPQGKNMAVKMMLQYPKMIKSAKVSSKTLDEIIVRENIDIVISDNRYELSSQKVYSIFITHQLNIQTGGLQTLFKPFIDFKIYSYLGKFNEIWVPDFADRNLSGKLSQFPPKFSSKIKFIGSQSRFCGMRKNVEFNKYVVLAIMSGPEPQRSIFEKLILSQLTESKLNAVLLSAKPGEKKSEQIKNVLKISHLADEEFASVLNMSNLIISRPGYSSLMDLLCFGKKAVFIPTPGQTEQEYLAQFHKNKGHYFSMSQKEFNLPEAIKESESYKPLSLNNDNVILKNLINDLL